MAKIEVKDIKLNGAKLFDDSEGFMDELNEYAIEQLHGGMMLDDIGILPKTSPNPKPLPDSLIPRPIPGPCPYSPVIL